MLERITTHDERGSNLTAGGDDAVDLLIVGIASVPREPVSQVRIRLKPSFEHHSFHDDAQVYNDEFLRYVVWSQLDHDRGHVARRLAAAVHEVDISSWDGQTLLKHLLDRRTQSTLQTRQQPSQCQCVSRLLENKVFNSRHCRYQN